MSKIKKQVTLDIDTIKALEYEGLGSLSTGIELVYRAWAKLDKRPNPLEPKIDGRHRVRLDREAREKTAAEQKAYDAPRSEFAHRLEHAFIQRSPQRVVDEAHAMFEGIIPLDERMAIAEAEETNPTNHAERARADSQREARNVHQTPAIPQPPVVHPIQTLRLSTKALRGSNLFGTPEFMTDAQIQETNDYWETIPAMPAQPEIILDSEVL